MTERRQLNDDERRLTEHNLANLKRDLAYQQYLDKDATLLLDVGLEQNYIRKRQEYQNRQGAAREQIENLQSVISITEDQLTNGVEFKEDIAPAADVGSEMPQ